MANLTVENFRVNCPILREKLATYRRSNTLLRQVNMYPDNEMVAQFGANLLKQSDVVGMEQLASGVTPELLENSPDIIVTLLRGFVCQSCDHNFPLFPQPFTLNAKGNCVPSVNLVNGEYVVQLV